jgi:murein DD-endopeptidase MepM/ murein hydrolase activator NlpD
VPGDERAAVAEEPFDPGVETGYLRRGTRERELPVDAGAEPFDPGPGTGYDRRRAKRSAKERERRQLEKREAEARALSEAEQELVEERREDPDQRERLVRERQAELERERLERERSERRARVEREYEERERRALLELEGRERVIEERRLQAERESDERRRAELDRRARIQAERESAAAAERERRRRERAEHRELWERDQATIRRRRGKRGQRERKREEREESKRAAARRRRAKRQLALSRGTPPRGSERQAAAAQVRTPRPAAKRRRAPKRGQLAAPTAKAALALAAVTAVGSFLGAALGLPVPLITSDDDLPASLAGALGVNESGTPTGLTKGPYFPVVLDAPADFGESAAKFHANRGGRRHEGQDIFAKQGTLLVAVRDGMVIDGDGGKSFYAGGGGNTLVIYSPLDQRSYVYLHMLKPPAVREGEIVQAGQIVGQVGCTGSCDGPHLHFEVRNGRVAYGAKTKAIDPLPLLKQWPQAPGE